MMSQCSSCENKTLEEDVDLVEDFQISASEKFLESSDALRHKVVNIVEFFVYKYGPGAETEEDAMQCFLYHPV